MDAGRAVGRDADDPGERHGDRRQEGEQRRPRHLDAGQVPSRHELPQVEAQQNADADGEGAGPELRHNQRGRGLAGSGPTARITA